MGRTGKIKSAIKSITPGSDTASAASSDVQTVATPPPEKKKKYCFRFEYQRTVNGVPIGELKNVSADGDTETEAKAIAQQQIANEQITVRFTGNVSRKSND